MNVNFWMAYRFVAGIYGLQFSLDRGEPEPIPTGWFHLTMVVIEVFHQPHFSLFVNSFETTAQVAISSTFGTPTISKTERIRVGWSCTETTDVYGRVVVDELAMWNRELNGYEVKAVYDMYWYPKNTSKLMFLYLFFCTLPWTVTFWCWCFLRKGFVFLFSSVTKVTI